MIIQWNQASGGLTCMLNLSACCDTAGKCSFLGRIRTKKRSWAMSIPHSVSPCHLQLHHRLWGRVCVRLHKFVCHCAWTCVCVCEWVSSVGLGVVVGVARPAAVCRHGPRTDVGAHPTFRQLNVTDPRSISVAEVSNRVMNKWGDRRDTCGERKGLTLSLRQEKWFLNDNQEMQRSESRRSTLLSIRSNTVRTKGFFVLLNVIISKLLFFSIFFFIYLRTWTFDIF